MMTRNYGSTIISTQRNIYILVKKYGVYLLLCLGG
jgi:hypothetical protein